MCKVISFKKYKDQKAIKETKALLEDNYVFVHSLTHNIPGCCVEFCQLTKYQGQDWIMFVEAWVPATIHQAQALINSMTYKH